MWLDHPQLCWEWDGHKDRSNNGYPRLSIGGVRRVAHKWAWLLAGRKIPEGQELCHSCDNVLCIRPDHLFLGTHSDNMFDASTKGRWWKEVCANGHVFTEENTYWWRHRRQCRQCKSDADKRAKAKRKLLKDEEGSARIVT